MREPVQASAVPARFEIRAPHDALAGKIERGDWVICSRTARPRAGGAVLVVDAAGVHSLGRYQEAGGNTWSAVLDAPTSRELVGGVDVHLVATVLGSYFDEEHHHG